MTIIVVHLSRGVKHVTHYTNVVSKALSVYIRNEVLLNCAETERLHTTPMKVKPAPMKVDGNTVAQYTEREKPFRT